MSSSLGPHFCYRGMPLSRPRACNRNLINQVLGAKKRLTCAVPGVGAYSTVSDLLLKDPVLFERFNSFRRFVRKWLRANIRPFTNRELVSAGLHQPVERVVNWISSSYDGPRKRELLATAERCAYQLRRSAPKVQSHGKDETYPEFKHMRWINSRTDNWKFFFGPFIKFAEKRFYELPYFIKGVPEDEKIDFVLNRLQHPGVRYFESDFTSFEASVTPLIMRATSGQLYAHMFKAVPWAYDIIRKYTTVMSGLNICRSRNVTVKVEANRMSGEVDTSFTNVFVQLMLMLFAMENSGTQNHGLLLEGDDGLFAFKGPPPSTEIFAELGFRVKYKIVERLSDASFCGLHFDPVDKVRVPDIRKVCLNLAWSKQKNWPVRQNYRDALLRAKALSFMHLYNGVPVVTALCQWVIRDTADVDFQALMDRTALFDQYEAELIKESTRNSKNGPDPRPVGHNTRRLVARQGIPIRTQLNCEAFLSKKRGLAPIDDPLFDWLIDKGHVKEYSQRYIKDVRGWLYRDVIDCPLRL